MSGRDRGDSARVETRSGEGGPERGEDRDPTRRPETSGRNLLPGAAALALFVVFAVVFLTASFGSPAGFPQNANVVASIGYAMFNVFGVGGDARVPAEGFLAMFEMVDLVLVAALVGAVVLGRREDESADATGAIADGGRRLRRALDRDRSGGDD